MKTKKTGFTPLETNGKKCRRSINAFAQRNNEFLTGFTLVELLVVISIIALLLAILVPAMKRAREIAGRVMCGNQLKQVGVGMIAYASSNNNLLPADYVIDSKGEKKKETHPYVLYRIPNGGGTDDFSYTDSTGKVGGKTLRLAYLYVQKYIGDPKVFYCAGNTSPLYKYESYINPPPWGSLPQKACNTPAQGGYSDEGNQWVRCGYTYYPTDPTSPKNANWIVVSGSNPAYAPAASCEKFDLLDSRIPYMTDSLNSRSGLSHKSSAKTINNGGTTTVQLINPGINSLFKDGHVLFATNQNIFTDRYWDLWGDTGEDSTIGRQIQPNDYPKFYYRIFLLIGDSRNMTSTGR